MRKILMRLTNTRLYRYLLKRVLPFIRLSTQLNPIRGHQYHDGYNRLRPGHIILTVDKAKLTSLLIPGTMSHAALCVNKKPGGPEIAEMTHTDFTYSDFFDLCKEGSRVVIMECVAWDTKYIEELIDAAHSLKDSKYDMEFLLGVEALYCSELIYMADQVASFRLGELPRLQVDLSDLVGLGQPYLSPDGLLFSKNCWCVWDSDAELAGKMGDEIENILEGSK